MQINGWVIFYFPLFYQRLNGLVADVEKLAEESPDTYRNHSKFKLLEAVYTAIRVEVPKKPDDKKYLLGNTIAPHKDWRRVKNGLPQRYRLFFRFSSQTKSIVYVWLNDDKTLRKEGAQSDVYAVFKALLNRGTVPKSYQDLLTKSSSPKY